MGLNETILAEKPASTAFQPNNKMLGIVFEIQLPLIFVFTQHFKNYYK
jgi:hypothetical protein